METQVKQEIEGVELTNEHIGSKVTYTPPHAHGDCSHPAAESGTIKSWNDMFIFVEYGTGTAKATPARLLHWG